LNHGEKRWLIADDTTLMPLARRVLKQYRASCRDATSLAVTGLELNLPLEKKYPQAHG
jgi:hypothetical protein